MENDIFVTFVVPVFNAELFLKSFFLSLSSQTYQKFQCLFVFDKGNDDTLEILKRMVESSSFPCQILEKPSKEGVGKARDYALDSGLISTKYIMFIDVDDQLDPSFLEKLVCKAESEKADMEAPLIILLFFILSPLNSRNNTRATIMRKGEK